MNAIYLICGKPCDALWRSVHEQLVADVQAGHNIEQLFFYSESCRIGTFDEYPEHVSNIIEYADAHGIALYLCSAAFQTRSLTMSENAQEDFQFKGVGQFINSFTTADCVRTFS